MRTDKGANMKHLPAAFVGVFLAINPASTFAKVVTIEQKDNERVVTTVAGPAPSKGKSDSAAPPSKAELEKAKIKPKPPMTDPK
jgi:hypothetical protein